jgi:2,3-bisphosphoglycerate-dependent phosphoglycerate mutase
MQLYLIRHGQSENNALWDRAGPREERHPDPELTELGHKQAQRLAKFLADPQSSSLSGALVSSYRDDTQNVEGFDLTHLYCSPMIRAIDTGTYIARALDMPIAVWEDLHEVGGIFCEDGETGQEIGLPGNDRAYLCARYKDLILPGDGWGNGGWWNRPFEQREQRILRAQRFVRDLMCRHGGTDDRVAAVSHAGFCNYALAVVLDWPNRGRNGFRINNTAITRIELKDQVSVMYTNRIEFLPRELIS